MKKIIIAMMVVTIFMVLQVNQGIAAVSNISELVEGALMPKIIEPALTERGIALGTGALPQGFSSDLVKELEKQYGNLPDFASKAIQDPQTVLKAIHDTAEKLLGKNLPQFDEKAFRAILVDEGLVKVTPAEIKGIVIPKITTDPNASGQEIADYVVNKLKERGIDEQLACDLAERWAKESKDAKTLLGEKINGFLSAIGD